MLHLSLSLSLSSIPLFFQPMLSLSHSGSSLARLKSAHQKPTLDEPKRMNDRFRNCACARRVFFVLFLFFLSSVHSVDFILLSICVQIENALVDGLPFFNTACFTGTNGITLFYATNANSI